MIFNKIFTFLILLILVSSIAMATCTVILDKETYFPLETATATMSCDDILEKNKAYTLEWWNGTALVETDSGTTPATVSQNFFQTLNIPTGSNWTDANVTLFGSNLEGSDEFNVTPEVEADALIIKNVIFTTQSQIFIGKTLGITAQVTDENNKGVSGARCMYTALDDSGSPIVSKTGESYVGGLNDWYLLSAQSFEEGRQYNLEIQCFCGLSSAGQGCIDEDGNQIELSSGSTDAPFTINTWLSANTLVDETEYYERQELFICANLTNVNSLNRIPVEIYHQVRCSAGDDNDDDLDRALVTSDDGMPDERGISTNQTQMQCKRFIVPEPRMLQGKSSECYASTSVWVLDNNRQKIQSYVTSSPKFNITISDLNIYPDWSKVSNYNYVSEINLSGIKYQDYSGVGTGSIDVIITHNHEHSIKAEKQDTYEPISITDFMALRDIKNVTAYNESGDKVTSILEYNDDGSITLEVRDVLLNSSGYIRIELEFENFVERGVLAQEGINTSSDSIATSESTIASRISIIQERLAGISVGGSGGVTSRVKSSVPAVYLTNSPLEVQILVVLFILLILVVSIIVLLSRRSNKYGTEF